MTAQEAFQAALQHHQAGRLAEAETLYRQVLAIQPSHADAWHHFGVVAHQGGDHELAAERICQAISLDSTNAAAFFNLGEVYRALGRSDEAIGAFRRALDLKSDYPEVYNNLGNELKSRGQTEEAIRMFQHALELHPGYAMAHHNLGNTLRQLGRLDEALIEYRRALELNPKYLKAHLNVGTALREKGQWEAAAVAYLQALDIDPNCVEAYNNLGVLRTEQGQFDEAIAVFRNGLQIEPTHGVIRGNLGNALSERGRFDEAVAELRRALQIKPDFSEAWSNLATVLGKQGLLDEAIAAYRRALELNPEYAQAHSGLIFTLLLHPGCDQRMILAEQQHWDRRFDEPAKRCAQTYTNNRDPERRLRVGYLSADFRNHVAGLNVLPLFKEHDSRDFEILCYSAVARPDGLTNEFHRLAHHWRDVAGVTDEVLAKIIREDDVDILVDLMQHTTGNRLPVFVRRPAPVQASFAAYPGGAGLEAIGYRISDRHLEPDIRPEQVFLIDSFWCYQECALDVQVNDFPAIENGHVTFGSLGLFCKINEPVLKLWSRVLKDIPGSRLIILSVPGSHRQRTLEVLRREGIEADRVELMEPRPRREYFELYHRLDVVLDTFPYNGHTTTLDALWMGVPVVSLSGGRGVSRGGMSILSNLGEPDLVAQSEDGYVEVATGLAKDLPRLAELRKSCVVKWRRQC